MDITTFITQGREKALLYGDHSTYHAQLSKRLLGCRKKLGIATKNRGKFQKKDAVTAENIAENLEYLHLLLLTSERAWAQAMSMKTIHSNGPKGIVGRTRSHIVSRLDKAARSAQHLVDILSDSASGAKVGDILEAKGYASVIQGSKLFECQSWKPCLENYSTARVIYSALSSKGNAELYKDLLSETIDPSIRYAAYQLKTPRTVPIPVIARKAFPHSDWTLVGQINEVEAGALTGQLDADEGLPTGEDTPRTLAWRSREVKIEDAGIAMAWAKVSLAKTALGANLAKQSERAPHQVAASYDDILTATQDAVDATKQAIDEMRGEGVAQSDPRMQSLQITRTAVNYEMISWRIGRNRVLTGEHDGAIESYVTKKKAKKTQEAPEAAEEHKLKEASASKKLTKLKEKVALYEGTLQNIQSITELPGVAADEGLSAKLAAFDSYFKSLKALAIARSHAITDNASNALALIQYAFDECQKASQLPKDDSPSTDGPLDIEVSSASVNFLGRLIHGELQRYRAIVHIDNLRSEQMSRSSADQVPLAERLDVYPIAGANINNVVEFPPKKALIPMKPLFLDIAWNYINYPSKKDKAAAAQAPTAQAAGETGQEQKRGWFGFGR